MARAKEGEEGFMNSAPGLVHFRLEFIQIFVKTKADDFVHAQSGDGIADRGVAQVPILREHRDFRFPQGEFIALERGPDLVTESVRSLVMSIAEQATPSTCRSGPKTGSMCKS